MRSIFTADFEKTCKTSKLIKLYIFLNSVIHFTYGIATSVTQIFILTYYEMNLSRNMKQYKVSSLLRFSPFS